MTEKERFLVDDAGTLMDLVTRDTYDIVEEVVDVLNNYEKTVLYKNERIKELTNEVELYRHYVEIIPIEEKNDD